jgi:hypothetical protein
MRTLGRRRKISLAIPVDLNLRTYPLGLKWVVVEEGELWINRHN